VTATDDDLDSDLHQGDKTPVADAALTPTPSPTTANADSVRISSYDEVTSWKLDPRPSEKKLRLFLRHEDDNEEEEKVVVIPPDSSFIFQDIAIPTTMTCQEYRSNSQFTVYQIEVSL
jgi:hypothetical protein